MKLSDYVVDFFQSKSITKIFGYQGGMITHLVDSISRHSGVDFIQVYHEQTGAIAAEGFARLSNIPGVCISTSGPGASNMITGIADAYFDSIPTIYITGQVNTHEYKYDKRVRQLGFQETDVVSIIRPITKYAVMIEDPQMIAYELEKAYHIAMEGRRGPVLLDIPMNILKSEIDNKKLKSFAAQKDELAYVEQQTIDKAIELIMNAKRPIMLIGGGVVNSNCEDKISDISSKTNIPFVTSLMGKSAMDETAQQYVGMLGSYGNRMANIITHQADLVIALGTRLDTRQTGVRYESFLKKGSIIHVEIDEGELEDHRIVENRLKINLDVRIFIELIYNKIIQYKTNNQWIDYCKKIKLEYNQNQEIKRFVENKAPYTLLQTLNKYTQEGDIVTADVGQNQMWAAQTIELKRNMRFLTSGGLAPMGYSMPIAIGASFATNYQSKVWAIAGDGGFHMSTQSLMLISQYNLPITVIVINNESLGMITQFQELYFNKNYAGTDCKGGYLVPDIKHLAKAYGLNYWRLKERDLQDKKIMDKIFTQRNGIVEYLTEGKTKVFPKLEFDKPFNQPSPLLPDNELTTLDIND